MCGQTAQLILKILGSVIHLVDDLERGTVAMCGQRGPKAQEIVLDSRDRGVWAQASMLGLEHLRGCRDRSPQPWG